MPRVAAKVSWAVSCLLAPLQRHLSLPWAVLPSSGCLVPLSACKPVGSLPHCLCILSQSANPLPCRW